MTDVEYYWAAIGICAAVVMALLLAAYEEEDGDDGLF